MANHTQVPRDEGEEAFYRGEEDVGRAIIEFFLFCSKVNVVRESSPSWP